MRRRTFLSAASLAAAGTVLAPSWLDRILAEGESLRALRGGMHLFSGRKGGSIGVFLSKDAAELLVVKERPVIVAPSSRSTSPHERASP